MAQKKQKKRTCPIPPEKRGKKPTLSGDPNDPTVYVGMRLPLSLKNYLHKIGPKKIKRLIEIAMDKGYK
jgi:hypothetical protein